MRKMNLFLMGSFLQFGFIAGQLQSDIGTFPEHKEVTTTAAIAVFMALLVIWYMGFETAKHFYKHTTT